MTISPAEIWRRLAGLGGSPGRTAFAFGAGVFIGFLPVMPLQTALALLIAFFLRLNRIATLAGTLVWQPFTFPFILSMEYAVGSLLWGGGSGGERPPLTGPWGEGGVALAARLGKPILVGAPPTALFFGAAAGLLLWTLLRGVERARKGVHEPPGGQEK